MNKFYTLIAALSLGMVSYGQIIFESDLSSWTAGDPDGWMGVKTNISSDNVVEQTIGVEHGTSMAQLFNSTGSHVRFTTEALPVTEGETYEIKMWVTGTPGSELRTAFYDATNDAFGTYNTYFDVYTETGGDLTMLSQTVTIPSGCTSGEFILSLRNTDDVVGILVDSVSIGIGEPVEVEEVSIYDIQYSTDVDFVSPYAGEVVTTRGIVTGVFLFGGDEGRFFIQDGSGAWNGIYVYENGTTLALGDSVAVTGTVTEFFTLTEMTSVTSINIISSGNPMPAAVEVSTADVALEEYEGVLVKVTNAKCTNDDAGFGQFEVDDNTGLRLIDDEMFSYTAAIGTYYNITGVAFLSFGDTKIYPRMIEDIEVTGYAGIEENNAEVAIYPNPANDFVRITSTPNASISIYSMTGELVYNAPNNQTTVDVSALESGIYQVVITDNQNTTTQQLVIK